jgi:hypothetical protein
VGEGAGFDQAFNGPFVDAPEVDRDKNLLIRERLVFPAPQEESMAASPTFL